MEKVRVLVRGYLVCPKCRNTDHAVEPGGDLEGVFCCTFMEPVGDYVLMSLDDWRANLQTLKHTTGWEARYKQVHAELSKVIQSS